MGNVNNYEAPPAPIMGIAAAIGAVRNLYGIGTDKAEAALKNSQTALQDEELKGKQIANQHAQSVADMDTKVQGFLRGDGSDASVVSSGGASSPLGSFQSDNEKAKFLRANYPQSPVAMAYAEGIDKNQALSSAEGGVKAKIGEEFLTNNKELFAQKNAWNDVLSGLKGNKINQQLAMAKFSLVGLDVKRFGESMQSLGESQSIIDKAMNAFQKAKDGKADAEEIGLVRGAAQRLQAANNSALQTAADAHAKAAEYSYHIPADDIKKNLLSLAYTDSAGSQKTDSPLGQTVAASKGKQRSAPIEDSIAAEFQKRFGGNKKSSAGPSDMAQVVSTKK